MLKPIMVILRRDSIGWQSNGAQIQEMGENKNLLYISINLWKTGTFYLIVQKQV